LNRSISALKVGGRISIIGLLSGARAELDIVPALIRKARLQAINVGSRSMFEKMNRAIEQSGLHPKGVHFGKVCIAMVSINTRFTAGDRQAGSISEKAQRPVSTPVALPFKDEAAFRSYNSSTTI